MGSTKWEITVGVNMKILYDMSGAAARTGNLKK